MSEGPFAIGRARYGRGPVDRFPGGIKDVMVFDRALTEAEVRGLVRPCSGRSPGTGAPAPASGGPGGDRGDVPR